MQVRIDSSLKPLEKQLIFNLGKKEKFSKLTHYFVVFFFLNQGVQQHS